MDSAVNCIISKGYRDHGPYLPLCLFSGNCTERMKEDMQNLDRFLSLTTLDLNYAPLYPSYFQSFTRKTL
jgi:hypothetical protein